MQLIKDEFTKLNNENNDNKRWWMSVFCKASVKSPSIQTPPKVITKTINNLSTKSLDRSANEMLLSQCTMIGLKKQRLSIESSEIKNIELKRDNDKSDYRSTFRISSAHRKGGFIKVLSKDKIKGLKQMSIKDKKSFIDERKVYLESSPKHKTSITSKSIECRYNMMHRFRSLLIKQK